MTFLDTPHSTPFGRSGQARQTERSFERQVTQYAELMGWNVRHDRATNQRRDCRACRAPLRCAGCATLVTVVRNDPGMLDLLLIRRPRILWVELKSDRGKLTPEQRILLDDLRACGQEAYVFKPSGWPTIEKLLR